MKHTGILHFLISFLCFLSALTSRASVISFENGVLTGWSTSKGSLRICSEKVKLGKKALCWEWENKAILTLAQESSITSSSINMTGGVSLWLYNGQPTDQSLKITFLNHQGIKCSIPFKLNFKGWRSLWADYGNDMGLPKSALGTLTTMQIIAPEAGSGKIYIDCLEFQKKVSWEKMSDFQYMVKEAAGTDSYLLPRQNLRLTPETPNQNQRLAIQQIIKRLDHWYIGSEKHANNHYYQLRKKAINNYIKQGIANLPITEANGTLKESGLFPHALAGTTIDQIPVKAFRNISESHLIQLAYDYRINNRQNSLNKIFEIYDWYYDQGWADGSALGTLRFEMLRSAGYHHSAMMIYPFLGEQKKRFNETEGWFSRFGDTCMDKKDPGELADFIRALAMPKLFYALTLPHESLQNAALTGFAQYMDNAVSLAHGFLGSLKPDGSGYHHRGPYYSAYYPDVLYATTLIYYLLHDTPFAMSNRSFENLKQALLTFRFFCAEYNVPGATTGRFPAQTEVLQQLLPAFAYLIAASNDAELIAAYKRLWKPELPLVHEYITSAKTDICYSNTLGEMELLLDAAAKEGVIETNPVGTCYLPFSGMLIVRQPEWMFTVKGFSKYIWDYESSGRENLYGRYLSYGHIEYNDLQNKLRSYQVTKADTEGKTDWDWRLLTGTTTKYLSDENLSYNAIGKHRNFSGNTFLGGIGFNNEAALFTMRLHDREIAQTFYADKSVFVVGNAALCIGSNITDTRSAPFFSTTLFQQKGGTMRLFVNGKEVTGTIDGLVNPTITDNFGNSYLVHNGSVNLLKTTSSCIAYINHGKDIRLPKSYAYTWLIKPSESQLSQYTQRSPFCVLSQDTVAHAVYHTDAKILAASIFKANTALNIRQIRQVSKPLLIMLQERDHEIYDLAISNPDMDRESAVSNDKLNETIVAMPGRISEMSVELEGTFEQKEDDENIRIITQNGKTTITVLNSQDGRAYRTSLKKISTDLMQNVNSSDFEIIFGNDKCFILNKKEINYTWKINDLTGKLYRFGNSDKQSQGLDLTDLTHGVYLLNLINKTHNQIYKFIK